MSRAMSEPDDPLSSLDSLPDAARIRSRKRVGTIATMVVDATALDEAARNDLEKQVRDAALAVPGITQARSP